MKADPKEKSTKTWYESLSPFVQFLPIAVGVIYFLGFVIVALHFMGYGVSPLELFRLQYLAAGLWFVLIVGCEYGIVTLLQAGLILARDRYSVVARFVDVRSVRFLAWVILFLFLLLIYFSLGLSSSQSYGSMPWTSQSFRLLRGFVIMAFTLGLLDVSLPPAVEFFLARGQQTRFEAYWSGMQSLAYGVIALVSALVAYSDGIYARIPFTLGGGAPRQAIFHLPASTGSSDSFLERDGATLYTIPYSVLMESESLIIVVSPKDNQRAIELERKSVEAVIILGKRPSSVPANIQKPSP